MKKLFMLFSLMFMPMVALADMGAPIVASYNVEVTNPDGVPYYEEKCENNSCKLKKFGTLSYGTKTKIITHLKEEKINNEIYIYFSTTKEYGLVKLSDLTILDFNVEKEDIYEISSEGTNNLEVVVDEVNIHSGPASGYDIVGTLKKGTVVNALYYYRESAWYYIEKNGIKGWVSALGGDLVYKYNDKAIITKDSDILNQNGEKIGFIKEGTTLDGYYDTELWTLKRFIKYNDVSGFIEYDSLATENKTEFYVVDNLKLFKTYTDTLDFNENKHDNSILEVPKDNIITTKFFYVYARGVGNKEYYQVNYQGTDYWFSHFYEDEVCEYEGITKIAEEDINIYDAWRDGNLLGTIKKGEEYMSICSSYLAKEDLKGTDHTSKSIKYDNITNNENNNSSSNENNIKDDIEDNTNDEKNDNEDEIIIENKSLSKNEIIYISIGLAAVFVLSSIVTIILINKKKKIKNEE